MSLPPNWRQLQLFDVIPIRDPNLGTDDQLYSSATLSSICASETFLIVAIDGCFIKIISQKFQSVKSYIAYDADYRISFVRSLPNSDLVVSVAEKHGFPSILKLWDLDKIIKLESDPADASDGDAYKHKYQTQVLVANGDNAFPISCLEFNSTFSCIVVGYTNGKVIVIRGDLIRDRGYRQRVVYESPDPVTGLHINDIHELVYVTTTSKILTVSTTGRNQGKPTKILSRKTGVPLQCSAIDPVKHELIIGTDTSIRCYNHLTKSHAVDFEVKKKLIYRYTKNYLLIVSPAEDLSGTSSALSTQKLTTRIVIIDLYNKHISFAFNLINTSIVHVFEMWDSLCLLSTDGVLYKIHEKPINEQVEIVLQRELFNIAYTLASQAELPPDSLLRILRLHAEFLYDKQDYDESMRLYIDCLQFYKDTSKLNNSEESLGDFAMTIITNFKDASNINNLTEFLYQLHSLNIANCDHITLLLCCYCKLKLVNKLNSFINNLDLSDTNEESELQKLNFPLLINLFKECGYFTEVIKLLFKLNQPNLIVGIQLNDLKNSQKCLDYIQTLPIDELLLILIDHSKTLLDDIPIATTQLLIDVFTGKYVPKENSEVLDPNFKYNNPTIEKSDETDQTSKLNSYKGFLAYIAGNNLEDDEVTISDQAKTEPTYLPPKPSLIFASFIINPNEFVIFLEACIDSFDKYQGSVTDKKDLMITLFEMYLTLSRTEEENKLDWFSKASSLLHKYPDFLDSSAVLILSHIFEFKEGEVASKEQNGYEESLFRMAQLSGDVDGCFDIVRRHGDAKPELFKLLMRFIVSSEAVFRKVNDKDFKFVLNKIKSLKLATPLEIVQILSTTEFATIGLIKDYLIDIIDTTNREISNNERLIESYEKESTKNSHLITELTTKPFIMQNNICSACNLRLDVPVIHFKCKHSFHQRCLNQNFMSKNEALNVKPVCSICINDIDAIETLRDDQFRSKDETELFKSSLDESNDKHKVLSNYLGKGVMENDYVSLLDN